MAVAVRLRHLLQSSLETIGLAAEHPMVPPLLSLAALALPQQAELGDLSRPDLLALG